MNKMLKRVISLVLALIMVSGMLPMAFMSASAATGVYNMVSFPRGGDGASQFTWGHPPIRLAKTTSEYKSGELRSDVTISVKVVDEDGNTIKYTNGKEILDSEKITVKASFFRRVIAFIKVVFFRIETIKTN